MVCYVDYEVNYMVPCPRALQYAVHIIVVMTNTSIYLLGPPWAKYKWYMSTSTAIESGEGTLEAVTSLEDVFMVV